MATYVTKKCPYCKNPYQVWQSGDQWKYGSPLLTCSNCNKMFWDTDIKEPALYGYDNIHESIQSAKAIMTLIFMTLISLALLGVGIWFFISKIGTVGFVAFSIGSLLMWLNIRFVKRIMKESKDDYNTIITHQAGYDASLNRLKNNEYLLALSRYDNKAKKLLEERENGQTEHYASRPKYTGPEKDITDRPETNSRKENHSDQTESVISPLYCNKCGAELSTNSLFCRKCGAPVANNHFTKD